MDFCAATGRNWPIVNNPHRNLSNIQKTQNINQKRKKNIFTFSTESGTDSGLLLAAVVVGLAELFCTLDLFSSTFLTLGGGGGATTDFTDYTKQNYTKNYKKSR